MLVDISGWLCALDVRDRRHAHTTSLFNAARERITHSFIISELIPLCDRRGIARGRAFKFVNEILDDPRIEVIWVGEDITIEAFDLLQRRMDKDWSLCDAVSFVIMESRGILEALTTDRHFEQAGFIRLLDS
jgi:predicted nucleic acid-binding protein